jgi:putative phage-type endonuclease
MKSFIIIDIEPNSTEHFEFRKGKIGASMAPDIMSAGFDTPLELWEQLMFDKKKKVSASMSRGITLEPKAREWINNKLKADYQPKVIQSIENPWRIASLDGYVEKNGEPQLLEIKCPGVQDHLTAIDGHVPDHYMPQLQHQMDVANVDSMHYCSFDGVEGTLILVKKDKEYCKKLLREETLFKWRLDNFVAPEPLDKDWVQLSDQDQLLKAERHRQIRQLLEELSDEKKEIEYELQKDLPHVRCAIGDLKIQKIIRKGNIAYDKIEELTGVDLEKYRRAPVSYWRFD